MSWWCVPATEHHRLTEGCNGLSGTLATWPWGTLGRAAGHAGKGRGACWEGPRGSLGIAAGPARPDSCLLEAALRGQPIDYQSRHSAVCLVARIALPWTESWSWGGAGSRLPSHMEPGVVETSNNPPVKIYHFDLLFLVGLGLGL